MASKGGYISGPTVSVSIKLVGHDANGRCLYSINGGPAEYVISAAEAKASGDYVELLRRRINGDDV